ncbi:hypothetical protein I6A84_20070 [Frankia sp. CNm7]|uniref:Uncharacterized protein n=1 Tax=Frankia nepalensis TaxID=1836974 RepID=A0A937RP78_9ACTN|nr:hypothetical protein [Frankia nepalensis]MBL7495629.1 hypothetical protein [Frankia nepalensis]MBL7508875.1 hypothetical protein [Frankia nepalensis]MBL7520323.1 hypothetical protein [Frankia nepalensis]MBL7630098.1 hypothetical protein [Frankia nepalensis]
MDERVVGNAVRDGRAGMGRRVSNGAIATGREAVVADGARRALGREPIDSTDFTRSATAAWMFETE